MQLYFPPIRPREWEELAKLPAVRYWCDLKRHATGKDVRRVGHVVKFTFDSTHPADSTDLYVLHRGGPPLFVTRGPNRRLLAFDTLTYLFGPRSEHLFQGIKLNRLKPRRQ